MYYYIPVGGKRLLLLFLERLLPWLEQLTPVLASAALTVRRLALRKELVVFQDIRKRTPCMEGNRGRYKAVWTEDKTVVLIMLVEHGCSGNSAAMRGVSGRDYSVF